MPALELALVAAIILVNGYFALSELAIASARPARLKALAAGGDLGAAAALALRENPGRYLSTVQVGITFAGMFAGAFSGATLAGELGRVLQSLGLSAAGSQALGLALVVAGISYLTLIVGELVPKQIALRNAERIAARVARPMARLARLTSPLVWLLDASSRLCLRILGVRAAAAEVVTHEEIRALVAEAETAGIVEPVEKAIISRVMRLSDRPIRAVMTPRRDIEWIDLDAGADAIRAAIRQARHARLPAAHGSIDTAAGVLETKDVLDAILDGRAPDFQAMVKPVPALLDSLDVLDAVSALRGASVHLALVVDEYGLCEGIVTTGDILKAIAGEFSGGGRTEPLAVRRDDGSWLLDGAMPVEEMTELLGLALPDEGDYHTVAGLVLTALKHLPSAGEWFVEQGWRFEVVDMDGRRVDKVLAARQ